MAMNSDPEYETEIVAVLPDHLEPNWYEFVYMKCQKTVHNSPETGERRETYTHHWLGTGEASLPSGEPFALRQITGRFPTPKSNLGKLILALTGRVVQVSASLPLGAMEGKHARLLLDVNEAGYNTIEKVQPLSVGVPPVEAKPVTTLAERAAAQAAAIDEAPVADAGYAEYMAWKLAQEAKL